MKEKRKTQNQKQEFGAKKKIARSVFVISVFLLLFALLYILLLYTGVWQQINSAHKIKYFILSLGFYGKLSFVILQFLQVTFVPIPSTITTIAGVLIYGPLQGFLLSYAGILLGSIFAFFLGRHFGRKLVVFMVGEESCEKWIKFLSDGKYAFVVMMFLPIFPDDILCLVAGLTTMSTRFFVLTNIFARAVGILVTCYLGSGDLIPYHGWGLAVWASLLVVVGVLIFFSFKYQTKIEKFLKKAFSSKRKRKNKE